MEPPEELTCDESANVGANPNASGIRQTKRTVFFRFSYNPGRVYTVGGGSNPEGYWIWRLFQLSVLLSGLARCSRTQSRMPSDSLTVSGDMVGRSAPRLLLS